MRLNDVGAELFGAIPAGIVRLLSAYGTGLATAALATLLDAEPGVVEAECARLRGAGLLVAEGNRWKANRSSVYWGPVEDLLNCRSALQTRILADAQILGGIGSRVALYGGDGPPDQFSPVPFVLLLDLHAERWAWHAELEKLMLALLDWVLVVQEEDPVDVRAALQQPDLVAIRAYVQGDDLRGRVPAGPMRIAAGRELDVESAPIVLAIPNRSSDSANP